MFNWLRELLEIRAEFNERKAQLRHEGKICESCETLKKQLEIANFEKKQLLDRLLEKPPVEERKEIPISIPRPKTIPWIVKKQILEAEDRERAKLLRNLPKPESTEELEKELQDAAKTREVGN
jgi:hypothetical protein